MASSKKYPLAKAKQKKRFTLVELLVSMAVLLIILGFILQFFTGSQRLWTSMEQRNNIYADARVAMDVMTTMLQNSFYSEGGIPFQIDRSKNYRHKIYFATQTMQNLPGGRLKYVSFQLGDSDDGSSTGTGRKDELKIAVFCDEDSTFPRYFPPYGLDGVDDLDDARTDVIDKLNGQLKNTTDNSSATEKYGSILSRRVTSLEIIPYELDTEKPSGIAKIADSVTLIDELPYMIELKLSLLSPADFSVWKQMSGSDDGNTKDISTSDNNRVQFRKTRAYTFTRAVFIGEQSRMNIND
ncbi:MAG: hypothetical protein LBM70_05385 [Victivallales bacterium]|nr:hypothetical protein [Victivallales bacterium]